MVQLGKYLATTAPSDFYSQEFLLLKQNLQTNTIITKYTAVKQHVRTVNNQWTLLVLGPFSVSDAGCS